MTTRKRKHNQQSLSTSHHQLIQSTVSKEALLVSKQYLETHIEFLPHQDFSFLDEDQPFRDLCASLNVNIYDLSTKFADILSRRPTLDLMALEKARVSLIPPEISNLVDDNAHPVSNKISSVTNPPCPLEGNSPSQNAPISGRLPSPFSQSSSSSIGTLDNVSIVTEILQPPLSGAEGDDHNENCILTPTSGSASSPVVLTVENVDLVDIHYGSAPQQLDGDKSGDNVETVNLEEQQQYHRRQWIATTDDIRFKLPRVLVKAFNTMGDKQKFQATLSKYCLPSIRSRHKPQPFNTNPIGPKHSMELLGLESVAAYYDAFSYTIPDLVFDLKDVHWKFIADGSCAVILSFLIYGTKVFHTSVESFDSVIIQSGDNAVYSSSANNLKLQSTKTGTETTGPLEPTLASDSAVCRPISLDNNNCNDSNPIIHKNISNDSNHRNSNDELDQLIHSHLEAFAEHYPTEDVEMDEMVTGIEKLRLQGCLAEAKSVLVIGTMIYFTQPDGMVYDMACVFHNRLEP